MDEQLEKGDPQTYAIIGAAMAVHRELGHGFLEAVYREALGIELGVKGIAFQSEVAFALTYRDCLLRTRYRADLLCFGNVIVEIKAVGSLGRGDDAQLINYLKASGMGRGLLLNFGGRSLQYRRLALAQTSAGLRRELNQTSK